MGGLLHWEAGYRTRRCRRTRGGEGDEEQEEEVKVPVSSKGAGASGATGTGLQEEEEAGMVDVWWSSLTIKNLLSCFVFLFLQLTTSEYPVIFLLLRQPQL